MCVNTTCLPVSRLSPSTSLPRCHHVTGSALCSADVGEQLLSSVSTCNITRSSLLAADPGEQLLSSVSTCNITCSSLLAADPGERSLSNVSIHHLFLSAFSWPRWTIAFQCFNTSPVPLCFQLTQVNDCFPVFQHITCSSLSWCRWTIAFQCFNTSPVPLSADAGEQLLSSVSTHHLFLSQLMQVNNCFPVFQHITCSSLSWCRWTIAFQCFNTSPVPLSADAGEQLLSSVSTHHLFLSQLMQVNNCFPVFQHITCSSLSWCRWTIAFQCFNTSPVPLSADAGEQLLSSVSTHHLFLSQLMQVNNCFPVFQHITCSSLSWCRWTIAFQCFNTLPVLFCFQLTQVNDRMVEYTQNISLNSPSAALLHTLQRHRDILQDYSHEFQKTRANITALREREDLLGSVRREIK